MRGKIILRISVLFLNFILPSLGTQRRCHVAWFRIFHSPTDTCIVKFAHREPLPSWLDKLQLEESLSSASDEELDALAKDVCSCAFFRVMRSCPASVYEIVTALSWRCFPGARGHVMQRLAAAVERRRKSPTAQDNGSGEHGVGVTDTTALSYVSGQTRFDSDGGLPQQENIPETAAGEISNVISTAEQTEEETTAAEGSVDDSTTKILTSLPSAAGDDVTQDENTASTDGAVAIDVPTGETEEVSDESSQQEVEHSPMENGSAAGTTTTYQESMIEHQYDGPNGDRVHSPVERRESDYDADSWKNI